MKRLLALAALAAGIAAPANAVVVISDDFDSYAGNQVPWNGSGVWATGNSVDLVPSGGYGLTCFGGTGNCVDLSGSTPGSMSRTVNLAPGTYRLSFAYTGNQLGSQFPAAGFTASLGSFSNSFTGLPNNSATFTNYTSGNIVITGSGPTTLTFTQNGGDDFRGSIIDNVSIAAVPEPATWGMMILGFGLVGAAVRRRRTNLNVTYA